MASRGRPAGFDRDSVLKSAMLLFWEKGFEATAMSDLVSHMGIQSASIYTAFGSKEKLFDEAVKMYVETIGPQLWGGLEQHRLARDGIESVLRASARIMVADAGPSGCLVVLGAIAGGNNDAVVDKLQALRRGGDQMIATRLQRAIHDGEIARTTDVDAVTIFYSAIQQSIAFRARDGDTPDQLAMLIDSAMSAWPVLTTSKIKPKKQNS